MIPDRPFFLMRVLPCRLGLILFGFSIGFTGSVFMHTDGKSLENRHSPEFALTWASGVIGFFLFMIGILRWKPRGQEAKTMYDYR